MESNLSSLFENLRAYKKSRLLSVALHMDILSAFGNNQRTLSEIAMAANVSSHWLEPILGVLVEFRVIEKAQGLFNLTPLGIAASSDEALNSFAGYHFHCFSAWELLPAVLVDGRGGMFHQRACKDPDFVRSYLTSLDAIAQSNLDFIYPYCQQILAGNVLDIGAGPATLSRQVARGNDATSVTALDLPAINEVAVSLFDSTDNLQWVSGDFWTWQPNRTFDAIFCSHFMEYCGVGRFSTFLGRIKSLLTEKGDIVLITFLRNGKDSSGLDLFEISTGLNGDTLGHVFSEQEIRAALAANGLDVINFIYVPNGPSYPEVLIHCKNQ